MPHHLLSSHYSNIYTCLTVNLPDPKIHKKWVYEKTFELFRTYFFLKPLQSLDNSWTVNKLDKFENLESFDRF